jgi:hypothetical protein
MLDVKMWNCAALGMNDAWRTPSGVVAGGCFLGARRRFGDR